MFETYKSIVVNKEQRNLVRVVKHIKTKFLALTQCLPYLLTSSPDISLYFSSRKSRSLHLGSPALYPPLSVHLFSQPSYPSEAKPSLIHLINNVYPSNPVQPLLHVRDRVQLQDARDTLSIYPLTLPTPIKVWGGLHSMAKRGIPHHPHRRDMSAVHGALARERGVHAGGLSPETAVSGR